MPHGRVAISSTYINTNNNNKKCIKQFGTGLMSKIIRIDWFNSLESPHTSQSEHDFLSQRCHFTFYINSDFDLFLFCWFLFYLIVTGELEDYSSMWLSCIHHWGCFCICHAFDYNETAFHPDTYNFRSAKSKWPECASAPTASTDCNAQRQPNPQTRSRKSISQWTWPT